MARILLVDSDEEVREEWGKSLVEEGYKVTQAGSVKEVREFILLFNSVFDVAVVNIDTIGESGLKVIEIIKKVADTEVIIIITKMKAETVWNNIQKAVELGVSRWLWFDKTDKDFGKNLSLTIKGLLRYRDVVFSYSQDIRKISARAAHKIGTRMAILEAPYLRLKKRLAGSELEDDIKSLKDVIEWTRKTLKEFSFIFTPFQLAIQRIELNEFMRKILPQDPEKGIRVELSIPLISIEGDMVKLQDMFLELARNAGFAMPDGGTIKVRAEVLQDMVKIEFQDTGTGIPEEDKSKIFEPFFGRRGSSGLGLSIVKHIVKGHKGRIEETGAPGEGARFIIYLPIRREKEVK